MRIALYQPEIAGNVGTVLRTAACFGAGVDLIEPMGFPWGAAALRRAGMDYVAGVDVVRHADWDAFLENGPARLVLATTRAATTLWDAAFAADDVLLFGSESAGVPDAVHAAATHKVRIPIAGRSLNLAVSVGIVLAEAVRQTRR
jgi:tRNA (cytidine/uridine-2'-O-)-methyltransferase